ncbi:hypothetical protein GCM10027566_27420 [Arachidicoccus ginsenosidivorans]
MPNNQNASQQIPSYVEGHLLRQLILLCRNYQKLGVFYKSVLNSLNKIDDAITACRGALWRLQELSTAFQKRLNKEKLDNIELHSTYYLKAITFLQDFESEATEKLFTDTRKQIKTFIYSSLYESMDSCENSASFKALFKKSEGLEFDFWITERLTQIFLRIREYLSRGHGILLDADQLPATENDLFESIKRQVADKLMNMDMEVLAIPINDDQEDMILNWSINGCNYRIRQGYFKHAFKLSIFINKQLEDIAHGMGLARLGNLFAMEAELLQLAYKDAGSKEKMGNAVSLLKMNVGDKKEDIQYWSKMTERVQEAIYHYDSSNNQPLEKLESEWLQKILDHPKDTMPRAIVTAFCGLLKHHKKMILRQTIRFELEGKYLTFPNPNFDYQTISEEELEDEILILNDDNQELREDLKVMDSSPDALFQLIKQKSGSKHNVSFHEGAHQDDLDDTIEDFSIFSEDSFWNKLDATLMDSILSDSEGPDFDDDLDNNFDDDDLDNDANDDDGDIDDKDAPQGDQKK